MFSLLGWARSFQLFFTVFYRSVDIYYWTAESWDLNLFIFRNLPLSFSFIAYWTMFHCRKAPDHFPVEMVTYRNKIDWETLDIFWKTTHSWFVSHITFSMSSTNKIFHFRMNASFHHSLFCACIISTWCSIERHSDRYFIIGYFTSPRISMRSALMRKIIP